MNHDFALAIGLVCAMGFIATFSIRDKVKEDWVAFAVTVDLGAVVVFFASYMLSSLIAVGV